MSLKNAIEREKEIFEQAVEIAAPDERSGYVKGACAGDADLLARVQALLRAHVESGDAFLPDEPAMDAIPNGQCAPVAGDFEKLGERIGRYRLLQAIGEGGCGTVFMAEQEEPVRRRVALKVIKLGMDTKEVIARFEAERQALAMMDHANIAKVLDAGATETGRPFFVMELVRGIKITDYCDQHHLPTAERLELFLQVCHAVQHAHQKGIVHRDIKPSNILVTVNDGLPVPKVIDFGIAKATLGRLSDHTFFTAFEQFLGTPAYMSPEQAEMGSLDVDTRSDIYSLGVLLYELLTGRTPFGTKELTRGGLDEMRRHIREVEPPRPSTRLSTLDKATLSTTAQHRHTDALKLINLIRGDLDWIVMRCLEKDRTRRYETATTLAQDVQRHLDHEPVVARPTSTAYRFRKLVRRNRLAFAGAGAVATALVLGMVASMWEALRANREADRANVAERTARNEAGRANAAEHTAREEAAIAKAVNDFLVSDLLRQADSRVQASSKTPPNPDLKVREALDRAAEKVGTRFKDQPRTEAAVREAIGTAYDGVGNHAQASLHLERALQLRQGLLGTEHPSTLASMNGLAVAYRNQAKFSEAIALFVQALEIRKRVFGSEHPDTLASMSNLAVVYFSQGKYGDAAVLFGQALEIRRRVFGAEHPETLKMMMNLAATYASQAKYAEAAAQLFETLEIMKRVLGEEHPDTLASMNNLAATYSFQGKYTEAAALNAQTLAIQKRVLGAEHPDALLSMNNLANAYYSQGKFGEATTLQTQTYEIKKRVLGAEHPSTIATMNNLGRTYHSQGRYSEAAALQLQTLTIGKRVLGAEHPQTLNSMNNLAETYASQNKPAESAALHTQTLEIRKRVLGAEHPETLNSITNLADVHRAQGKFAEAEPALREALVIRERKFPDDWRTFNTRNLLGSVLAGQKKFAEAEPLLISGYEGMMQREGKMEASDKVRLKAALEHVVQAYTDWAQPDKAAGWQQKLDEQIVSEAEKKSAVEVQSK